MQKSFCIRSHGILQGLGERIRKMYKILNARSEALGECWYQPENRDRRKRGGLGYDHTESSSEEAVGRQSS